MYAIIVKISSHVFKTIIQKLHLCLTFDKYKNIQTIGDKNISNISSHVYPWPFG